MEGSGNFFEHAVRDFSTILLAAAVVIILVTVAVQAYRKEQVWMFKRHNKS